MIQKVLIANRGEIACRVIHACRKLGIASVAVYSDADAQAPHVFLADESVRLGPARSAESYLNIKKIIDAAHQTGADAVHPGYGFLAENEVFATEVINQGLIWVGPSPQSILAMGDKQNARELAIQAGVPVVPGQHHLNADDPEAIEAEASRIGFPLLVKAAAGGGGMGMRQVLNQGQLAASIQATRSQAKAAFGSEDIFLEKYISKARHIEVQVFGFGSTAVHMYERDCSLQRRFQKVIEEGPAPGVSNEVVQSMQNAAIALATSVKYEGAGTVEFILDVETENFYFLEMNTRIQVEHPVTEMITGLDLVAMQLQYAGGQLSKMEQREISQEGHAIECRLYAEAPEKNFMPSPGTLTTFDFSRIDHEQIRVETGYEQGGEITPFYDPMIAKIIARGIDRECAIKTMLKALFEIKVEGVRTNLNFLIACLQHAAFHDATISTSFISDYKDELFSTNKARAA